MQWLIAHVSGCETVAERTKGSSEGIMLKVLSDSFIIRKDNCVKRSFTTIAPLSSGRRVQTVAVLLQSHKTLPWLGKCYGFLMLLFFSPSNLFVLSFLLSKTNHTNKQKTTKNKKQSHKLVPRSTLLLSCKFLKVDLTK